MNPTASPSLLPSPSSTPAPSADPSQFGEYSDWAKQEMAKGFTPEQLHQTLAESGTSVQSPKSSGNWLTHLLPTIGSVAAPALGALLAPETGGLSLVAAAGLSGLGAAGGKAAENATEGKSVGNDVGTAGLEGAAGGAAGGVVSKVLGKGAEALGGAAEKMATNKAAQEGAQEGIDSIANAYKDVSPQLQKAYNAKDSLQHVADMGFDASDPGNLVHVANTSNDVLNDVLNRALTNSGPVDLSHYPQIIKDAISKESGTLGSFDKVALARGRLGYANTPAAQILQQLEDLGAGVAKTTSDPNELRTLTTKLGQLAQDAKPTVAQATGAIDPKQRSIYNVINDVRDQVKGALYDRPEVNDALKGTVGNLTPEDTGTKELADHLNDVISKAGQGGSAAQDLLSEISRNINIGNLGQEGQRIGQIVTSTGAKARAASDAGLNETPGSGNPVIDMAGHLVNPNTSILSKAVGGAAHAAQNPAILQTLSRIGSLGAKLAPAAGSTVATSPNLAADPTAITGMPGASDTMGGTMNGAANSTLGGNDNSINSILGTYMRMGQVDPYLLSSTTPLVQALAPVAQRNQLLGTELNAIPASFANAGGAQGPGGIMSRISALIPGTAAHQYQQQREATAAQLAQTMGISPQAAAGSLPEIMSNQGTAAIPQSILSSMAGQLAY